MGLPYYDHVKCWHCRIESTIEIRMVIAKKILSKPRYCPFCGAKQSWSDSI